MYREVPYKRFEYEEFGDEHCGTIIFEIEDNILKNISFEFDDDYQVQDWDSFTEYSNFILNEDEKKNILNNLKDYIRVGGLYV